MTDYYKLQKKRNRKWFRYFFHFKLLGFKIKFGICNTPIMIEKEKKHNKITNGEFF